ncbi:MAG: ribonuclease R [Verrucomicrobiales bacterium]|nr:ribonuclease R [Verrucomicrobiales bacterium]
MNKDLFQQIQDLIGKSDYRPLNKSEFARELGVPSKERASLRKALSQLVDEGTLELGKKSRYYKPSSRSGDQTYEGVIMFSFSEKRRSAFFNADHPEKLPRSAVSDGGGVYISRRSAGTAIHGDRVSIKLVKKAAPKWHKHVKSKRDSYAKGDDRLEGVVVEILQRNTTTIVGTYEKKGHVAILSPDDKKLPPDFHLKEVLKEAKPGDVVVAEFLSWANTDRPPAARMTEVLGRPDAPGVDMLTVIHRYRLPLKFPDDVLSEAEVIDTEVTDADIASREDWRDREVFTIDPEDARDFDDAIAVTELNEGWELAVHIADVSHYVKPGTALDKEARKRGNSVYLADRVIPMLPEKLSNGVCSLNPHVDRLTHAAVMTFDTKGNMNSARFVSAVIRSCRRYTYEEAFTRLKLSEQAAGAFDDPVERSVVAHMQRAWRLAETLRKKRFKEGCFDLDFPEVRAVLDENGIAFAVKKTEHDESHQLIEEFMLAANEAVARETKNEGAPSIYRIHEDPDPEKLQEFADLARDFGHSIGDPTVRSEIQKLTRAVKGKPEEHSTKMALLKSMMRAAYSKDPIGHFGLAKVNYCHFTSPIRRYADLIVHRALKKIMSRRKEPSAPEHADQTPTEAGAGEIAAHISRTERVAADAERDSQQLKLIEYLENLIKDDSSQTFEAIVTDVRAIGIFVELKDLMVRGLIRRMDLPSRYDYYLDKGRMEFVSGSGQGKNIAIAKTIQVRLIRIDKGRGFIDFTLA